MDRAHLEPGDRVLFSGDKTFADATLMPGRGLLASGTAKHPIVFGSYGRGMARLTRGIWLGSDARHPRGPRHLTFENLALGPTQGFLATGDYISLMGLRIGDLRAPRSRLQTGIASEGSHWVIEDNTIFDTGDSGMLLGFRAASRGDPAGGADYRVAGNIVSHTGLDQELRYASHAIYLKVAHATVSHNRLSYFRDDGISVRYRDATISDNYIAHGSIGIAWFQYDLRPGKTRLIANVIENMTRADIFVCGVAESCARPIESFVVKHNRLRRTKGQTMNLQPSTGTYRIQANAGLP